MEVDKSDCVVSGYPKDPFLNMKLRVIISIVLLLFGATFLPAAEPGSKSVIVHDTFNDGSRDKTGKSDANWRKVQSTLSLTVVTQKMDHPLVSEYWLKITPGAGNFPTIAGIFDDHAGNPDGGGEGTTLGPKNGDKLELSLDFRFENPYTPGKEIRVGLFNNSGTTTLSDTAGPTFIDDVGYWVNIPQNGGPGDIYKKTGGKGTITGGADKILLRKLSGPQAASMGTNRHTVTLTLIRDPQGIVLITTLDGVLLQTGIDTPKSDAQGDPPGLYTVFQEIGVGTGAPEVNPVYITNVKLQATSSEASEAQAAKSTPNPTAAHEERKPSLFRVAVGAGILLLLIITVSVAWMLGRRPPSNSKSDTPPK